MPLRQGMDQMRESVERKAAERDNQSSTHYVQWKDRETKVVRFLTQANEIYFLKVHDYVPCADGKPRSFICATEDDRECELCAADVKVREKGYGIGLEREPVPGSPNSYQDVIVSVDGKDQPVVGVVSQAWNNFWKYVDAYYQKFGTLRDYDLDVTRHGDSLNTDYTVIPNEKKVMDLTQYAEFAPDLAAALARMVSPEYYAQHLHGVKPEGSSNGSSPVSSQDDEEERRQYEALTAKFGRS